MNALLDSSWLSQLGWVLIHSLWQGALLWTLLALVFTLGRKRLSAAAKHRLAWLTLTALALAPVGTLVWLQSGQETPASAASSQATAAPVARMLPAAEPSPTGANVASTPTSSISPAPLRPSDHFTSPSKPTFWLKQLPVFLASAWMLGLLFLILRLLVGWSWLKHLRHTAVAPDAAWHTRFLEWSSRASLQYARVLISPTLGVPLVIGWLRPAICFPASLLSRLSIAEVETLMLHELAHLNRRDPLLHLWVIVVETLLFHNPAAHALASTVRRTGELACDDLVLQWQGDGKTYARALAATEEWRETQFALAATGASSLKHRIQRILGLGDHGRLSSLPERFGITSVAGIALYFAVLGIAVPPLARALTPEQRVALITKERETMKVTSASKQPQKLTGEGIVRTADGSAPAQAFSVSGWSEQYSGVASKVKVGEKFTIEGRGNEMTVSAWVDGYALAVAKTGGRAPNMDRVSFELVLERGSPMRVHVTDEAGNPIPNAKVSCAAIVTPNNKLPHADKPVSDDSGAVQVGHASAGQLFEFEVYAHGWQWQQFPGVKFQPDKPIILTLRKATPITGVVLDARTQQPVAGAEATCLTRHGRMGGNHYVYSFGQSPDTRMSSHSSDASGRITLDVCHADEQYEVLLEAPGYARQKVHVTGLSTTFQASMQPEVVLAGVVEDPRNELASTTGEAVLLCFNEIAAATATHSVGRMKEFKKDSQGRIPFSFHNLNPGKVTLSIKDGGVWHAHLSRSVQDVVLRSEQGKLRLISGAADAKSATTAMQKVTLTFHPPVGSPPYQGEVTIYNNGNSKLSKVTDSRLTVELPVDSSFHVYPGGATGYTFDITRKKVVAGAEPMLVDIPMTPAGAISGDIRWDMPESERAHHTEAVLLVQRAGKPGGTLQWDTISNQAGELLRVLDDGQRYFISPASLNDSYRVVLIGDNSFAESDIFRLDESAPMARKDMTFARGLRVSGKVSEPDGSAMRGGSVKLLYVVDGQSFLRWIDAGADGSFVLPHLNYEMSGRYYIIVPSTAGCATLTTPIEPGSTTLNLQRQKAEVLEGSVTDSNGKPLTGIQVSALKIDESTGKPFPILAGIEYSDAPSNVNGQFRFSTLPKGTFRITAYRDDAEEKSRETAKDVQVTGEPGQKVELRMPTP